MRFIPIIKLPQFDLEIVQPLFNPRDNWVEKYIERYEELQTIFSEINIRIVFVNDGSTQNFDKQVETVLHEKIKNLKIISYAKNMGKGFAVRKGVEQTESAFVLYTDYDFPYEMSCLYKTYQELKGGKDVVIGTRTNEYHSHLGFKRKLVSRACIFLNKVFLKISVKDTQSGLKGFSSIGKELMLDTKINQFLFDTEFVCKAYQNKNIKVSTVEIRLREGVKFTRVSLITILNETKNFISILIRTYFGDMKT